MKYSETAVTFDLVCIIEYVVFGEFSAYHKREHFVLKGDWNDEFFLCSHQVKGRIIFSYEQFSV